MITRMHFLASLVAAGITSQASAALTSNYQFNGNGNWSIDAVGSNNTPVGTISAIVPLGSTIERAFLYSTSVSGNFNVPTIDFNGVSYSGASWTSLGVNAPASLTAWRTDVTSQVMATVGGGSAAPFSFSVNSESPNSSIDGEILAIVYSNPGESYRTIAFLDGFSSSTGDSTSINLADPITAANLADPDFNAMLSLGIGYGFQGTEQFSRVDVNGQRLTTSAGGQDDGVAANGGLVTVGGIGDDPANPADPFALPSNTRSDDELYTLNPFLGVGNTLIKIDSLNPSSDDNIFFAGVSITARAGVDQPPPPPSGVPDSGSTIVLLGATLLGLRLPKLISKRRN